LIDRNTGVAIDTVNFVWTFGFLGYLVGSLLTGLVFKRFIRTAAGKLVFLFATICLTGVRIEKTQRFFSYFIRNP
jgi:predicted lipid-binding transport protein (Tim44 family)